MKTRVVLMMLSLLLTFSSCIVHRHPVHTTSTPSGKLPPGQAKKVYGTKSAKPFAPGQQKK